MTLTTAFLLRLIDLVSWISSLARAIYVRLAYFLVVRCGLLASWRFSLMPRLGFFQIVGGDLPPRLLRFLYLTESEPTVFGLKALMNAHGSAEELSVFVRASMPPQEFPYFFLVSFLMPDTLTSSVAEFRDVSIPVTDQPLTMKTVSPWRLPNIGSVGMGDLLQNALEPVARTSREDLAERLKLLESRLQATADAPEASPDSPGDAGSGESDSSHVGFAFSSSDTSEGSEVVEPGCDASGLHTGS
jgi:hypothetical protein